MDQNNNHTIKKQEKPVSLVSSITMGVAGFSLAAAGSWILYSNLAVNHAMELPEALPDTRKEYISPAAGRLSYYTSQAKSGRPLVLIHSINAAASAYEFLPLFMYYRTQRPVFALDLPGFGFSDRSKRVYSPALYEAAILDFLTSQVGEPADVVALSLGSEFAAAAALAQPDLFNSLVLISPTGFSRSVDMRGSQKASRSGTSDMLHAAFSFTPWARPFYDLLTTRASIEFFLKRSFIGAVPLNMIDYAYVTSHQPGAENAPFYFISGKLFTPDIRQTVYEAVQVPTLVLYDRDGFTNFDHLPGLLQRNQSWQAVRLVPSLGLPQFERLEDTVEVLNRFWE